MADDQTPPGPLVGGPITRLGRTPPPPPRSGRRSIDLVVPVAAVIVARRRFREVATVRHQLVHLPLHDALTGLPNRRLLLDWLAADITRSQRGNTQTAVLFVDLDRFKFVNDTHGHEIGDRLMRHLADRLETVQRPGDRLVRYGGDEFVLVCPGLNGVVAAASPRPAPRSTSVPPLDAGEFHLHNQPARSRRPPASRGRRCPACVSTARRTAATTDRPERAGRAGHRGPFSSRR
jgi:GGDEF domain-containing protein